MEKTDVKYSAYVDILREELVPAMGCTEPAAIAYAAASARDSLGAEPERCEIEVSGNIIKNVKSVIVPNTGGLKGIEAAVAAGVVAGRAGAKLEVLAQVSDSDRQKIAEYLGRHSIRVTPSPQPIVFLIDISLYAGAESSRVVIIGAHTNIIRVERNGEIVFAGGESAEKLESEPENRKLLDTRSIVDFAETVDIDDVAEVIERQIEYNTAVSREGLTGRWGAQIGRVLLDSCGGDITVRARAAAAAGSDARMSGCEKPVVIVSGSGNQGMTASLPVIEYAKELGSGRERLIRALVLSNLITIRQKTGIGRLSAFCGAVSAGCGAAAAIAWLYGGDFDAIAHTIVNTLAIVSGMVCDGAKPSCAAKISAAVDAGIMGYHMYRHGQQFYGGDGIITEGVDRTIDNIGRMAREGMRETDREILKIMSDN